jgi:hypothetical protein
LTDTLLKAATLYLATHPFMEPKKALPAHDELQTCRVQMPLPQMSQPTSSVTCSQFTSQPFPVDSTVQSQLDVSQAAQSAHGVSHSRQRFDLESVFLDPPTSQSFVAPRSYGDASQTAIDGYPLLSQRNPSAVSLNVCSDIMSSDFEKYVELFTHTSRMHYCSEIFDVAQFFCIHMRTRRNFMNSLLPPPRLQAPAEAAAATPSTPAFENRPVARDVRTSFSMGTSLKEIADRLCTSTRRA